MKNIFVHSHPSLSYLVRIIDDIDQKFVNDFQLFISSYGTSWLRYNNDFISWLKKNKTFITNDTFGYIMDPIQSHDIDTLDEGGAY